MVIMNHSDWFNIVLIVAEIQIELFGLAIKGQDELLVFVPQKPKTDRVEQVCHLFPSIADKDCVGVDGVAVDADIDRFKAADGGTEFRKNDVFPGFSGVGYELKLEGATGSGVCPNACNHLDLNVHSSYPRLRVVVAYALNITKYQVVVNRFLYFCVCITKAVD